MTGCGASMMKKNTQKKRNKIVMWCDSFCYADCRFGYNKFMAHKNNWKSFANHKFYREHTHTSLLARPTRRSRRNSDRSWLCQSLFPLPIGNGWSLRLVLLSHMYSSSDVCFCLFDCVEGSKLRGNVKENLEFPPNGLMDSFSFYWCFAILFCDFINATNSENEFHLVAQCYAAAFARPGNVDLINIKVTRTTIFNEMMTASNRNIMNLCVRVRPLSMSITAAAAELDKSRIASIVFEWGDNVCQTECVNFIFDILTIDL